MFGLSQNSFALSPVEIKNMAVEDASNRCFFAGQSSSYDANSPRSGIQMNQIAQESFTARNLPGTDWRDYSYAFLTACDGYWTQGYASAKGTSLDSDITNKAYEKGESDGINNFQCRQSSSNPSDYDIESIAVNYNPYDPITQTGLWELYIAGFKEGCLFIAGGMDTAEDPTTQGRNAGQKNSECNAMGKADYREGKSKSYDAARGTLVGISVNPYTNPLESFNVPEFVGGFVWGCETAYNQGYREAENRDKSSVGSFLDDDGGCLIATAAYGTELAPEVQNLREIRNKMYETNSGGQVMHAVNDFYYSFSPQVSDWERENPTFREAIKLLITPSMTSFTILDHNSIDTESGLVGYVVGAILLNVGMYFVVPAMVIIGVRKQFKSRNS